MIRIIFITIIYFQIQLTFANNPLSLKDILTITLDHNPQILAAKEKTNQIESQKDLALSSFYPNLTWNLDGNYLKDALFTKNPKFGGDPYNTYSSDFKLTQTLYARGVLSAVKYAEYDQKIQSSKILIVERELTQNVIEVFYRFILNQQLLEYLNKNQDLLKKSLVTSSSRYQRGRGLLLDVLQIKTQLALIEPRLESAKAQIVIAAQELISLMGGDERPGLKLKGRLKTILLANIKKYMNTDKYKIPEYELNLLQISQIDQSRNIVLGKYAPSVRLVGDYMYDNYEKSELFSDYSNSWAIQLQLVVPLFNGFASNHQSAILTSQEAQLRMANKQLENDFNLKQIAGLKDLERSELSLVSLETAVKLSIKAQEEASRMYKLSQIDFLQYLTIQQAEVQAKTSLDLMQYQSIVAYSNYFIAAGQSLSILVDILNSNDRTL